MIEKLGFGGTTELASEILDGTADVDLITKDEASKLFLLAMKRNTDTIDIDITQQDMMDKYKRWKEKTTTSPSG